MASLGVDRLLCSAVAPIDLRRTIRTRRDAIPIQYTRKREAALIGTKFGGESPPRLQPPSSPRDGIVRAPQRSRHIEDNSSSIRPRRDPGAPMARDAGHAPPG